MPVHFSITTADGTPVTAQGAYNAFMNTRVLMVRDDTTYEAISMVWYDNNSSQDDPTNVGYVGLSYVTDVNGAAVINVADAGDSSLVPASGG